MIKELFQHSNESTLNKGLNAKQTELDPITVYDTDKLKFQTVYFKVNI